MIDDSANHIQVNQVPSYKTTSPWTWILGAGVILLGGVAFYEGSRTDTLKQELTTAQHDNAAVQTNLTTSYDELQKNVANLKEELAAARQETGQSLARTQSVAARHADQLMAKLEQKHNENEQQLSAELNQVKASTDEASAKLTGISTDVGDVKTDVGSVKNDVATVRSDTDKNSAELQRALGDMGVMSGLIATNGADIKILRALGDRNIYEFTLTRSSGMQKVGDIQVALDKADAKKNRFTVDIMADDRKVEKKDKGINEPVQFYVPSRAKQPYELVVNEVSKNTVKGYLATPKVTISRNEPVASNQ
jgi:archaellum component FlaC